MISIRQRGAYMGIVFGVFSLETAVGPLVDGTLIDGTTWRWVFYINLSVSGAVLILHLLFPRVNYDLGTPIVDRLKRIDYAGNVILIGSIIFVPLFLGVLGLGLFHIYEGAPWVKDNPTLLERAFTGRTPTAALVIAFINFICLFWVLHFLPIYFQAILGTSPTIYGLAQLPTALLSIITGAIVGVVLTRTGRYRPLHIVAFALIVLGFGLFSRFDRNTSNVEWVIIQIIAAFGLSISMPTNLPEFDTAAATAAFAFVRAYGSIWGVLIPAAIFNAKFASESWRVQDPQIEARVSGRNAYEYANADFIQSFPEPQRPFSFAFVLLGFFVCFLEKEIAHRTHLETEFGL
ncbi:MFS general substrate transporter [Daldinia bambusicola]|nr:MFS general substrate transporter [Daldinia bambusicola]